MIEAIVLAAGSSQRMGKENKLLKTYHDETIISHTIKQVLAAHVSKIIVVTGHQHTEVEESITGLPVTTIYNPYHLKGQLWSIRKGLEEISDDALGIMILLGDMPLLTPRHINDVIDYYRLMKEHHNCVITRPIRDKSIGHPTIWDSNMKSAILAYPEDERLKGLIQQYRSDYHPMEVIDDGYFVDIDTQDDYRDLVS